MRKHAFRFGACVLGGAALLTAFVGALHLPFAAPLLRKLAPASACPNARGTPAQIDRAHAIGIAAIRPKASSPAPSRPALGFELDKTQAGDVRAWAAHHGVTCRSIGGNENLQRCVDVPASAIGESSALGAVEEVTFELSSTGTLVNVQTMRRHLTSEDAARIVGELARRDATALGTPSTTVGEPSATHLSRALLATFFTTHTFANYRATVSATNLAETGVMVREEYLSMQ